jgi:integrase
VRESTKTVADTATPPPEAKRFLKAREGRVAAGLPVLPRVDRVRYEEAAADLREHYRTTGSRNLAEADKRLKPLNAYFTGRRLASIGGAEATAYVAQRQAAGLANGTVNRELAVLTKMLRLAYENRKLLRLPVIRKLKEAPPRLGFFERDLFLAVRARLPEDLQVAVNIAYAFGWRVQSEVLTLERRQIDLEGGSVRLEPGTTKNDDGRVVYLPPDLKAAVAAQLGRVDALQKRLGRIIPWLFPHLRGANRQSVGLRHVAVLGERRRDFRGAWLTACRKAGAPGMLKHDFRRTAVRNMVNRGIPERVAMTVTGHKTRSVFDRYHIVSPSDLQDVAQRLAGAVTGTFSGTFAPEGPSARLTPTL